jgi:amino acid transporter
MSGTTVGSGPAVTAPPAEATSDLSCNAPTLSGLVILGIGYMGLALTAYFNFGIMEGITGPVVPLAFAAVTLLMLPTAASYAGMNARRPSTGATLTWLREGTTPGLCGSLGSPFRLDESAQPASDVLP